MTFGRQSWRTMLALFLAASTAAPVCVTALGSSHPDQTACSSSARRDTVASASCTRLLLQNSSTNAFVTSPAQSASSNFSNALIYQGADVTLRLLGSDVTPLTNATWLSFQHSLQKVFSNYSYVSLSNLSAAVSDESIH